MQVVDCTLPAPSGLPAQPTGTECAPIFNGCLMQTPPADLVALQHLVRLVAAEGNHDTFWDANLLEVGSWAGRTALAMARASDDYLLRVFCVDHWHGSPNDITLELARRHTPEQVFRTFCANAGELLFKRIFPCRGSSLEWAAIWRQGLPTLDLVFLDGDHDYQAVREDILAWRPHVRPGGILCGHDYGLPQFTGVTSAVDELLPDRRTGGNSLWWVRL